MPDLDLRAPLPVPTAVEAPTAQSAEQPFDLSTMTLPTWPDAELPGDLKKIQSALHAYVRELAVLIHEVSPSVPILVREKTTREVGFPNDRHTRLQDYEYLRAGTVGAVTIWIPPPSKCYPSYTASPLMSRTRYSTRWLGGDSDWALRNDGRVAMMGKYYASTRSAHILCIFSSRKLLGNNTAVVRGYLANWMADWRTDVAPQAFQTSQEAFEETIKQFAKKAVQEQLKMARADLERIDTEIANTHGRLITLFAGRKHAQDKLAASGSSVDEFLVNVRKNLEKTQKMVPSRYRSVRFDADGITAVTQNINIDYRNRRYPMGYYKIHINTSDGNASMGHLYEVITITQMDPTKIKDNGAQHPHIVERSICWGSVNGRSFEQELVNMLINMEYFGILFQLTMYLSFYNDASPMSSISNWESILIPQEKEIEINVTPKEEPPSEHGERPTDERPVVNLVIDNPRPTELVLSVAGRAQEVGAVTAQPAAIPVPRDQWVRERQNNP